MTFHLLLLGMLAPVTAVPSDIQVALPGRTLANQAANNRAVRRALVWVGGPFLIGLGVKIVLEIGSAT